MKPKLLIIGVDEEIDTQMKWVLAGDYEIVLAEDRASAVEAFRKVRPLVVLLDLGLPPDAEDPDEALATLSELLVLERLAKIVIIARPLEKSVELRAIGAGAYDFLIKPVNTEELKFLVRHGSHVAGLEFMYRQMQQMLGGNAFEGMMGTSSTIRAAFESIRKFAATDAPILLLGESGTGKGMAARAIHQCSARKDNPFIVVNCSAIPETLLESELFGNEKESFPGAHAQRKGRFEMANGGTVFLDEMGEIPLSLQTKLLRFLDEQCIERVGGRQPIQIDARVVAATKEDLKKGMAAGTFRDDLFYRLAVGQVVLPPIREREGDVRLLGQFFLQLFGAQANKTGLAFDEEALRCLERQPWPGNVCQLENCVRRAVIMCEGKHITVRDLELGPSGQGTAMSLKEARENFERAMIQKALRKHSDKIAPAAAELGLSRPTLYTLMDKLGIAKE